MCILQDICECAKLYADLVHTKLTEKGYYDDEGQFDVTTEVGHLCTGVL